MHQLLESELGWLEFRNIIIRAQHTVWSYQKEWINSTNNSAYFYNRIVLIAVMWLRHFFIANSDSPNKITCQQCKIWIFLCRLSENYQVKMKIKAIFRNVILVWCFNRIFGCIMPVIVDFLWYLTGIAVQKFSWIRTSIIY